MYYVLCRVLTQIQTKVSVRDEVRDMNSFITEDIRTLGVLLE